MNDFWDNYDNLITDFEKSDKVELSEQLKQVKRYVNGLTDGWYDFKNGLIEILRTNSNLDKAELNKLKEIIKMTEKGMKN